jgi:AcrR family transcriptional regulator
MQTKSRGNTPRERRRDVNRQRILEAARKILLSDGLSGLSMRALADQIEYSPSALYKYFESKEEMLQAIREEGWQRMEALTRSKVSETMSPPEKLLVSGKAYLDFAETYPEHYLLMFDSSDIQEINVSEISINPRFSTAVKILEEGVASGHFKLPPGFTPVLLGLQLWISLHGISILRLTVMRNHRAEFDALVEQMMRTQVANLIVK